MSKQKFATTSTLQETFSMIFVSSIVLSSLVILHAGSLTPLMEAMAKDFTQKTGLKVERRAGGSLYLLNLIREKRVDYDLFFSADIELLGKIEGAKPIPFAQNRLVIAYTEKSKFAREINPKNFLDVLSRPGVNIGRSDPELDPCGYRALIMLQIMEKLYGKDLVKKIRKNASPENVRPKSAEILNLLELGEIDYAIIYLSEAKTRNFLFLELPDSLNFGNPSLSSFYSQFSVKLRTGEVRGTPIIYGYVINPASKNKREVKLFTKFLEENLPNFLTKFHFLPVKEIPTP